MFGAIERGHHLAGQRQRMRIVASQMIGHAGEPGVHIAAAQILGTDHLADRRLHQRRTAQENSALILNDDGLITHGRHISASCGA